jgi:hypothetical protein
VSDDECGWADEAAARELLGKHGYNPDAQPSGMSSSTGSRETWTGAHGILLRYWVCQLDGILIDGHEGSDLDPGSTDCIHCGHDSSG